MAGELTRAVEEFFSAFDRLDVSALSAMFTEDSQGVDELTRKWMRGKDAVEAYFREFGPALSDIRSQFSDVHEVNWGQTGVVTCWIEQDYKYQGTPIHFSGPGTVVLRNEGNAWRVALVHAVPMPEQAG
jgi:ketosteroid isomerase-like protein